MKAIQFSEYGASDVLRVVDAPEPHAGPDQIRIRVEASGVNGLDWKIRAGDMKDAIPLDLPAGAGFDAAGIVDEIGDGVTDVQVGDAVFGQGSATLAEFAVLDSWAVRPPLLGAEEAAGFPVPVETAIRILRILGLRRGQRLLVSGAAGGVGSALVQIAKDRGLEVIGTASERNQDYLVGLGAIATTYGDGLVSRVRALSPDGVDGAADIAGSGVIPELIELTGAPSQVVSIADFDAPKYGAQITSGSGSMKDALVEAARLSAEGKLSLEVERAFRLKDAAQAQDASASGHVRGRLVVVVAAD
ncbi:NADPH:quinone reductase [Frondihabitans sp. PAMC 28766]|uniref:NADP-dependent oxidoreductase n=1 Tax=Frondihabitans sp. PAMC 28766 TaxID=1795630 RepID=UPI00078D9226|nr:NADP-dependent oxidoreductase [Frondihabitans sp. PAMC 28766]AMM21330.1 NADPH:quinone reductase [Frondihabitans sp. PAMC 28766]